MSCQPLRILFENQLIGSQMTALPAALTAPINLLTEQRSRVFRSHQTTDDEGRIVQEIHINQADRAFVADSFAVGQHNLGGVDSIRLQLWDGENKTGEQTDIGVHRAAVLIPMDEWHPDINYWGETYSPAGLDRITPLWFDPVRWRSALITITSHSNPAGYIDIGMMMLGLSARPKHNFSWGNDLKWEGDTEESRTKGGSLVTERGMSEYRVMQLDLNGMDDDDRNMLSTACNKSKGKPILVSAYPETDNQVRNAEYTMMAKVNVGGWRHNRPNEHSNSFLFKEV